MKRSALAVALALMLPTVARAQSNSALTLDDAIAMALERNRAIESAGLAEEKAAQDIAQARTKRLPSLSVETQISRLLRPVDVAFPAGAFGTFDTIGAVPGVDTTITTPLQTNLVLNASVSQPITGLLKATVGVRQSEAAHALVSEEVRATRLGIVRQVRRTYYAILQSLSALEAADTNGRLLAEVARVVQNRVAQKVALRTDGLEMETRFAQNELTRATLRDAVASSKEQLNQLLGRELTTDFEVVAVDVAPISENASLTTDVESTPLASRPDVREAQLRVLLADFAVRNARLDRLPDVNLTVQTISPVNIDGAPHNISSAGIQVKWEPFDWGRRSRTVATKRLEAQRADRALRDSQDTAQLDINRQRRTVEQARATLRVAALSQNAAREQTRIRTVQYQAQAALFSDVLQAEASLAESTNQYQQALLSLLTARADLAHALGEDIVR